MLVCSLKGYWTAKRAGTYLSAWVKGQHVYQAAVTVYSNTCNSGVTKSSTGNAGPTIVVSVPELVLSEMESLPPQPGELLSSVYGSHIFPIFLKLPYLVFHTNSNWTLCCCFTSMSSISSFFLRRMSKSSSRSSNDRSSGTGERGGEVSTTSEESWWGCGLAVGSTLALPPRPTETACFSREKQKLQGH